MRRDTIGTLPDTSGRRGRPRRRGGVVALTVALLMALSPALATAEPTGASCWGQVSAAYAQQAPGTMGAHASGYETPRLGLRNLARSLDLDSIAELGAVVADLEHLDVPACA